MTTKVITLLVLPPGGPLLLVLLGLLLRWRGWRRTGSAAAGAGLLSLWLLSTPWVADLLVRGLERQVPPPAVEDLPTADAIVVLGGSIAAAVPPRRAPDLSDAADRVLHAARLFRAGKAPLVVVSGGSPSWAAGDRPEGDDVADLLVEWGVPREAILVEGTSLDTHQNAVETAALLAPRGAHRVLLVTSAMHMPRAAATFRRTGLEVVAAPTDLGSVDASPTLLDWLPDARALDRSARALHEHAGLLWYRVRGWAG